MSRSRSGILAGANQSILKFGTRKTTMGDIARIGGVAKATVYNHFRDKPELYAALVAAEVDAIIAECDAAYGASSADPLADCLAAAARAVASHPVLRRVAETEPAVLGVLTRFGAGAGWQPARVYAAGLLGAKEPSAAGDLGVRWVVSHATWPATDVAAAAATMAAAMRALAEADAVSAAAGPDFIAPPAAGDYDATGS